MGVTPLVKKLLIKPGYRMLLLNAPPNYAERIVPLPKDTTVDNVLQQGTYDWILTFVWSKADVDHYALSVVRAAETGTVVWFAYPKKSAKTETDISRDTGWEALQQLGWRGISLIAFDTIWSVMRFRPASEVKSQNDA
jgi:hypothetical protein